MMEAAPARLGLSAIGENWTPATHSLASLKWTVAVVRFNCFWPKSPPAPGGLELLGANVELANLAAHVALTRNREWENEAPDPE